MSSVPPSTPSEGGHRLRRLWNRVPRYLQRDLWDDGEAGGTTLRRRRWIQVLRLVVLVWDGLMNNAIFSRAAALSYSSLLGLGPLVAIMILTSGALMKDDTETQIKRALLFAAPTLQPYIHLEAKGGEKSAREHAPKIDATEGQPAPTEADPEVQSKLDELISTLVQGAENQLEKLQEGSQILGLVGIVALIAVGIQLLTSIETTFNSIWGVERGRGWGRRIIFYWAFISLGTLLGLASTAMLSASALAGLLDWMPFGAELSEMVIRLLPLISFAMLIALLTFCYQFFPNTEVELKPALAGAVLAAALLFLNNLLSILYVHRAISLQSLFGSLAIVPVLMFGLYFFWFFVLFGCQLAFNLQNLRFLTHRRAWVNTSHQLEESMSFAALLHLARAFESGQPPVPQRTLEDVLQAPAHVLADNLRPLVQAGWITAVQATADDGQDVISYQPGRPLDQMRLAEFHELVYVAGNNTGVRRLIEGEPSLGQYREQVSRALAERFGGKTVRDCL